MKRPGEKFINNQSAFDEEVFRNPSARFRGAPFWAWNCRMTKENIAKVTEALSEMGMGGGHIHCRSGMDNPYLGSEFIELVKYTNDKFKEHDMLTYLYDEDRWPSGAAGGAVTKNPDYRMRFLVFTPYAESEKKPVEHYSMSAQPIRSDMRTLLARYEVRIEDGWLRSYRRLAEEEQPNEGCKEWFAYMEICGDTPAFNGQAYVNTLDKKAIDSFIEHTHEVYAEHFEQEFGKTMFSIFTDEPQFAVKGRLEYAEEEKEVVIPWTDDLEDTYCSAYGYSLLEHLPELFWEREEERVSKIRYWYHDHVCERFTTAFADNIGGWCQEHNLMLTGHMMGEPTLEKQTRALGEALRSYRSFQLPGIDMLCDKRELSTAKQAQSASRQFGCPGVMSEMYGVTNWNFDFRGHKLQGDWQAALGVTTRVHHLTWTSMEGNAKRDYPASIGYQSPWYKEYSYVEEYFARINTLLTRGKAVSRIGVIHPIESYWLYWGCEEKTGAIHQEMEENFQKLIAWLLYGTMDFDFISESLLPMQNQVEDISEAGFPVGEMKYDAILVPNCVTLRRSTMERLKKWQACGGTLLFVGEVPTYLDAQHSQELDAFTASARHIPFNKNKILDALEPYREVEIRTEDGLPSDNLIYQLRREDDKQIFFVSHVNKMADVDIPQKRQITMKLKGLWQATCYEPLDGTKKQIPVSYRGNYTIIKRNMYDHDSLLLVLEPIEESELGSQEQVNLPIKGKTKELYYESVVPVTLEEPNVALLDMAEYSLDGGEWQRREEILRIDTTLRLELGYPLRNTNVAQPWATKEEAIEEHRLAMRFHISSELEIQDTELAMEYMHADVWFNGEKISTDEPTGWYVDQSIHKFRLGIVRKGENELLVEIPFGKRTNPEAMYLLGDFGVKVAGTEVTLTEPVRQLAFGDWSVQGLPFYGGNVTYHIAVDVPQDGTLQVEASKFRNPVVRVTLDDKNSELIAYSPYRAEFSCKSGQHRLDITAYGNRFNTFGALHNCMETETWCSQRIWYKKDSAWSYEYQLQRTGILKAPDVKIC